MCVYIYMYICREMYVVGVCVHTNIGVCGLVGLSAHHLGGPWGCKATRSSLAALVVGQCTTEIVI